MQPFIPKSTAKLSLGDYCSIRRDDGLYVPLVFLSKAGKLRTSFYGALLSHTAHTPEIPDGGGTLKIFVTALVDIRAFAENAGILGNIAARLDEYEVTLALEKIKVKTNVWGYRTPLKYAQLVKG